MKIIFVSHASSLTGAPKFIFELAKIFAVRHEVTFVTKQDGPLLKNAIQENYQGINYVNINNSHEVCKQKFAEKVETAKEFIQQQKPDFVYVNSVASGEWVVASRLCGVKNIFHIHEMRDECLSLLLVSAATLDIMDYADFVICASKDVEQSVCSLFDSQPPACTVMDYFFDCEKILEQSKLERSLPKNAKDVPIDRGKSIVCACGVASKRKGVDIFFDTAHQLPHLQFLWIGKWNSSESNKNPIEERYLTERLDNFFITGEVENPHFYLNLADLFVLSSREDPNPLIVIEALILGKQVVCFSKTGGRRFTLDSYGYVITGYPNVELLIAFINRIFPPPDYYSFVPQWLVNVQRLVIASYEKKGVLPKFEKLVEEIK